MVDSEKISDKQQEMIEKIKKAHEEHLNERYERTKAIIEKMDCGDKGRKILL